MADSPCLIGWPWCVGLQHTEPGEKQCLGPNRMVLPTSVRQNLTLRTWFLHKGKVPQAFKAAAIGREQQSIFSLRVFTPRWCGCHTAFLFWSLCYVKERLQWADMTQLLLSGGGRLILVSVIAHSPSTSVLSQLSRLCPAGSAGCRTPPCSAAAGSWPGATWKSSLTSIWGLDNASGSLHVSCETDSEMQHLQTAAERRWSLRLIGTTFVVGNGDLILISPRPCSCPPCKCVFLSPGSLSKFFMHEAPFFLHPTPKCSSFLGRQRWQCKAYNMVEQFRKGNSSS